MCAGDWWVTLGLYGTASWQHESLHVCRVQSLLEIRPDYKPADLRLSEREKEIERKRMIYIYIERERDRECK